MAKITSALLLISGSCLAQNAKDGPCQDAATTAAEATCFSTALKKSDGDLNQLYQRIQKVINGNELVKLKEAQRIWIQFRDANCAAATELYAGGSVAPVVKLSCLEETTSHRTEELKSMYSDRLQK